MNKPIINHQLYNLYHCGIVKKENITEKIETINKDYKYVLERKDAKLWYTDESYKYICKITFYNSIDIPVLEVYTSEINIGILLDNIYQYLEYNMDSVIVPFSHHTGSAIEYTFTFERNKQVYNNSFLIIHEYNNLTGYKMERLRVEFDEDSLIELLDQIFFTFLIDVY